MALARSWLHWGAAAVQAQARGPSLCLCGIFHVASCNVYASGQGTSPGDTHSWGRRRLLRLGASSLPLSVFLQSPAGRLVLWHAAVMTASPSPRSAQASRAGPDPAEYGLRVGGPLWSQGTGTRSSCPALGGERKGPFRTPESESGARPLQGPFRK